MTNKTRKYHQQSEHRSEFWPTPSAHRLHWETLNCAHTVAYDAADDGPEVRVIRAIIASHIGLEARWRPILQDVVEASAERVSTELWFLKVTLDAIRP